MAATVVLVVTFLTGVLVGRGVRAERSELAQVDTLTESPDAPERSASASPVNAAEDPRTAPPPPQAEDDADGKAAKAEESEEPPMAVNRNPTPAPAPEKPAAAAEPAEKAAPARPEARPEPAKAAAPKADPKAPAATGAPGNGYAVQVAAVNARGEADVIVKRLSGKGYAAYVETPKGSASCLLRSPRSAASS